MASFHPVYLIKYELNENIKNLNKNADQTLDSNTPRRQPVTEQKRGSRHVGEERKPL